MFTPKVNEHWVTRDYSGEGKALCLSKARLGLFVYELLKLGGGITSTYAMGKGLRNYVQMAIYLPTGKKTELEGLTGIALETPPTFRIN